MPDGDKALVLLHGKIKSPPLSKAARIEVGTLLRTLQRGISLQLPHSRRMPSIGPRCHELRVRDRGHFWRVIYRLDTDAVVIAEVFAKTTNQTPQFVIGACKGRFKNYDEATKEEK
jgi:phage-related protein